MKHLLFFLFALWAGWANGQDIPPSGTDFKTLQSPAFKYNLPDSTLWIYKGSVYGWTELFRRWNLQQADGTVKNIHSGDTLNIGKYKLVADSILNSGYYTNYKSLSKVDKEPGKQLSDNNFTDADSIKLLGIAAGATANTGTVTSVATGLGLSGGPITAGGTLAVDTTSTSILSRQRAANTYQPKGSYSTASGTANYIPKFTGPSAFGNSQIFDNGTSVGINSATPAYKVDITGGVSGYTGGILRLKTGNTWYDGGLLLGSGIFGNPSGGVIWSTATGYTPDSNNYSFAAWPGGITRLNIPSNGYYIDFAVDNVSMFGMSPTGGLILANNFVSRSIALPGAGKMTIENALAIGVITSTAKLHLGAGTAAAGTAPLKINAGTLLTTSEAGAIESDGTHLYWTAANGVSRSNLDNSTATGTVSSVATGLGLSGGPVTSTGTLIVDTASVSILSRQRAANTYQAKGSYLLSQTSHADVVVDGDFTSQGIMLRGAGSGAYSILTDNSANWNTAYSDRLKWDGGTTSLAPATGRASLGVNYEVQGLSGTSPTWAVTNGLHATITLTGNTTITLTGITAGQSGNIRVTNGSPVYTLTFAGYTNKISPAIYLTSNQVNTTGSAKTDVFSWWYDGTNLIWNGTNDYK